MGNQSSKAVRRFPTRPATPATTVPVAQARAPPTPSRPAAVEFPSPPATAAAEKGVQEEDPRAEHVRLLEHYQRMDFDVHSFPKREYRKDNEMINILSHRSALSALDNPTQPRSASSAPSTRVPVTELEPLFGLRRQTGMTTEQLSARFGLAPAVIDSLLRHFNTPEIVVGGSGASEKVDGVWVEDLVRYRREEASGNRSAI
ncbi:hypothetical protein HDU87_003687 [Geranomyces variabilis]|uniref:Uncharacterized protein n=1 Tax=Geranomyces variabilis TaxID=109894 RepID=A0AAD5TJR1_9FUNG|nr:hypothetical protein HDU87_003687 [Geranomyces variabilis]